MQCGDQDLLSSRKMSVSRMHSLPNDSYMFRPVRPASAPNPLEEVELSPQHQHSGNLSVQDLKIRHEISMEFWCSIFSLYQTATGIVLTDTDANHIQ